MPTEADDERDQRLDEAVLSYLKAREANPHLAPQAWLAQYPELLAFFQGQQRIDHLATLLHLLTGGADKSADSAATIGWEEPAQHASAAETQNQHVFGDYEILEEIGRGGMGRVCKARQRRLKRIVALKMMLAGAHATTQELQRFRSEAEAVARLQHPNIVQIYQVGELEGLPYFSLEYVDGGSLAAQLDGTPLPARAAAELVRTLAEAIQFAHQHGIIHRDLKPSNILLAAPLGQQGAETQQAAAGPTVGSATPPATPRLLTAVAKITDFGLAKRLDEESGQTKSGTILGTPSYMAPEQAAGQGHRVGPATDVYGLGAILYELLTGRPPFKAATPWETVHQVLNHDVAAPRVLDAAIDRDVETICLKCLSKDPLRRYASAQALADDLQRYLQGRPIFARPLPGIVKLWRLCRRHPGTSLALGVALLALVVLLTAITAFNARLQVELAQNEAANHQLQMSLTRQVADRIDSDLRQLTRMPKLMATTLAQRADWREDQLEAWMRRMLDNDERLFGTAVALEPRELDGKREDFALYAYRGKERVQAKMLLLPDYQPHYREHRWYVDPKQQRQASWSEPFFDAGGSDIPMLTYSVPIMRADKFAGVVTADLSVAYFEGMRSWLDEVNLGRHGYAFVISSSGTFISHPNPSYQMPKKISEAAAFQSDEALRSLTKRLLSRESGFVRALDPETAKPSLFYFAPVVSAQWSFVAVIEQ